MKKNWRGRFGLIGTAFVALACSSGELGDDGYGKVAQPSAYDPHVPPARGPWFEGWYTRITDADGHRSVAVVGAYRLPAGQGHVQGERYAGLLGVLVSNGDGAQTQSFQVFPQDIEVLAAGNPVTESPDRFSPADFFWRSETFGEIGPHHVDVHIHGQVELKATLGAAKPWAQPRPEAGPEGPLTMMPLPIHWHVNSLGSPADYSVRTLASNDVHWSSHGYAHQEKNWGASFPTAWGWLQATSADNTAHIVIAGGPVHLGPLAIEPWIVGFRSPQRAWDFSPAYPGHVIVAKADGCERRLVVTARSPTHTLVVDANAPLGSLGPIAIPHPSGWVEDGGQESFSALITVKAYRHDPLAGLLGQDWLVESRQFTNGALEFGADYACPKDSL